MDRWQLQTVLDTVSISQSGVSDANRAQIGDEQANFVLANVFTGNAGATAQSYIAQPIEGVRRLAGKTVTISFWANSSAAQKIGVNIAQGFGTGGSPSAGLWVLATGLAVTTLAGQAFSRFTVGPIAIPSIAGKTLGTNGNDATTLAFFYSAGANAAATAGNIGVQSGTVNLWGIQLELGPTATPLEKLDPQQDLAKCQRFYQISNGTITVGGASVNTASIVNPVYFPVAMRAAPTVAYGLSGGNGYSSPTTGGITTMGFAGMATATAASYVANQNWTASADF
jgi:hypothetical protein